MKHSIRSPFDMPTRFQKIARQCVGVSTGLVLLATSGCYRPYYYGPPMPTYQGPVAPIQTLTPGPSYIPGQTPAGGLQPIPANPSLGTPSNDPFFSNTPGANTQPSQPQPTFGGSNTDPIYNPPPSGGDNLVPNYPDPGGDFVDPLISPGGTDVQEFKIPSGDPSASIGPQSDPFDQTASSSLSIEPMDVSPAGSEPEMFDPLGGDPLSSGPLGSGPMSNTVRTDTNIAQTAYVPKTTGETTLDPYAFEEGTYAWLRGVVNQDPQDGSWTITYDLTPNDFDDFAGHLTLATDVRLQGLKDDDVVLVEGELSPLTADRFGKPVYEIKEIIPLNVSIAK